MNVNINSNIHSLAVDLPEINEERCRGIEFSCKQLGKIKIPINDVTKTSILVDVFADKVIKLLDEGQLVSYKRRFGEN